LTQPDLPEPVWIGLAVALTVHDRQLAEHGGPSGVRDLAMLESALAPPIHQWTYDGADHAALAAACAFGIVRNHPFVDGNKRTGWVIARLFLARNGVSLVFDPTSATRTMLAFAADDLSEAELADWFRQHIVNP